MVAEKFQIVGVKITGKFLLMSHRKTLPQILIITLQAGGDYPFPPGSVF